MYTEKYKCGNWEINSCEEMTEGMEALSLLTIVIVISGLIFVGVVAFFVIIFLQEIQEFKDSPLILARKPSTRIGPGNAAGAAPKREPQYKKHSKGGPGQTRSQNSGSGSSGAESGVSSLSASSVTLEMSVADEYGSTDSIVRCSPAGHAHAPKGGQACFEQSVSLRM